MYSALKTPSFLRPATRPSSPVLTPVDSTMSPDRAPRPLSRLSLATFRRPSPSPVPGRAPATTVQDGSYMDVLSLRLSEAVSKALAQSSGPSVPHELLNGRRPIPAGRGRALGALIAQEVKAVRENPHLYRAFLRILQRPLSVLLSNLSSDLLPLLSSSVFHDPIPPTPHNPSPNATQLHALGLATLAGELLETFDGLGLGLETDMRGDGLKNIREGLVSVVKRVIDPLMNGIKNEMVPLLEALETPSNAPSVLKGTRSPLPHPSIMALQGLMPVYARGLSRYVTSATADNSLASLLILLVWRGLVALSNRPIPLPTPPSSPVLPPSAYAKGKESKRQGPVSTQITTLTTPSASRFTLKLPPSRPVSPGTTVAKGSAAAADARALCNLLYMLPRPSADKETTRIAREAVDEAFDALSALTALLESVQSHAAVLRGRPGSSSVSSLAEFEADLEVVTADLPMLIALPVLLRTLLPTTGDGVPIRERTVASMLGLSETEYRKGCLSGFGRAEECEVAVGQRVLDVLQAEALSNAVEAGTSERMAVLVKWLKSQIAAAMDQH
ncbi:uncharacterized protein LAESUDRAFT_644161 [Laetiporus sulphureus 93-53]|uniref:Uncharacterized protein n=1 Tax=Laetiporus sulphureus 93-53 TaxID=1314785 RepID=A0A165GQY1_9APHY|nr:uncharacterized protein LAESUDRAFT_644161 [Laetiporus sulphureus 93-53]KZT10684.1 hypothetical protein LAESUDRAFT_644161 [Laetiporus sulphureus 93-53]